jgi:hypothetical protein
LERASSASYAARLASNLSLLTAVFACLALWGGIFLLFEYPPYQHSAASSTDDPLPPNTATDWELTWRSRQALADLLLFWLPIGLGTAACGIGVVTLAWSRERSPEASRRALIALLLSVVPGCLCTLWYLSSFAASPLPGR